MTEHLPEWEKFSRDQFDAGYAAGLDAAREVVVSVGTGSGYIITRNLTLAAIDELREKP